jgi:hypothetical protein
MAKTYSDKTILKRLCAKLNKITKKENISLSFVEIKGTFFFCPMLPAKEN